MRIPYTEDKSNEEVNSRIELEVGKIVNLLEVVRKRNLQWFGHVVRQGADSLAKTILEGMVDCNRSRVSQTQELQQERKLFAQVL